MWLLVITSRFLFDKVFVIEIWINVTVCITSLCLCLHLELCSLFHNRYVQMQSHQLGLKQPSPSALRVSPSPQLPHATPPPPSAVARSNGVASPAALCTQPTRPSIDELADPDKYFRRKVDVSDG